MNILAKAALIFAIIEGINASAISKLATGSASSFYAPVGTFSSQITAVGDPTPGSVYFNSGGYAPQYLQLELPSLCTVHNIFLQVEQTPNGNTIHELYAGPISNPTQLVATLKGFTTTGQWLHINFSPPLTDVRFLRINTVSSPSWVAWRKFLVF